MSRIGVQDRPWCERRNKVPPNQEGWSDAIHVAANYGEVESGCVPMSEWSRGDIKAHIDFQHALNHELLESGELVDAQGLAGPDQARFVVSSGSGAPVITDGPFPESKELLAGYRLIDVETLERAIEIAAKASAAPGPDGVPVRQAIEVRQVLSAPDPEV